MDCTQAREEFAALLDGELAPEERDAVEGHLSLCSDCLRELDGLKRVDVLYRQLPAVTAPAGFEERVRQGIRSNLILRLPRLVRPRRPMWPALLAAAGVVLAVGLALVWLQAPPLHMQVASLPASTAESAAPAEEPVEDTAALSVEPSQQLAVTSEETAATGGAPSVMMAPPSPEAKVEADIDGIRARHAAPEAQSFKASEGVESVGIGEAELMEPLATEAAPAAPAPEVHADMAQPPALKEEAAQAPQGVPMAMSMPAPAPEEHQALRAAPENAPARQTTSNVKGVAKRVFELKDGIWWESGYTGQGTTRLARGSRELQDLVSKHPELGEALELGEHVVFRSDGRWYRIVPHAGR